MVKYFFILLSIIHFNVFALEQVTASVDKNPIRINESFILEVIADDDVSRNALDTSPLLKDFIVGNTSVSSQTSIINGSSSKKTQWTTVLIAKNTGKFIIPALSVINKKTAPIALVVTEEKTDTNTQQRDIYLTTELSSEDIYVQQQATLTVKLHLGVNIERGSLSEPTLEDGNISQLGKDIEKEEIINGRRYRIIERKYAINPQKSGELTLLPPMFSGEVAVQSERNGFFRSYNNKPVNARSKAINLSVKPKPLNAETPWLPSELFIVNQEWQPEPEEFIAGVPITRTITVTAAGLAKEQLPSINMQVPDNMKVYPDQAKLHSGINSGKVVSQAVMNFAIVAEKSGRYTLPEIRIPWWNTVTNRQEYAILPEQNITIKNNPNQNESVATVNTLPVVKETTKQTITPKTITVYKENWLQWLFLTLWLLTSTAWLLTWYINKKPKFVKTLSNNSPPYEALISACNNNDGQAVIKNLLPWLQTLLTKRANIKTLSQGLEIIGNDEFTAEINNLQACYYSDVPQQWHAKNLKIFIQKTNENFTQQKQSTNIQLNP